MKRYGANENYDSWEGEDLETDGRVGWGGAVVGDVGELNPHFLYSAVSRSLKWKNQDVAI